MANYKVSFEQIRQQPGLTDLLKALERGFSKFGVDFYLVGAVSRDIWMNGVNKIAPKRTTGDIDFAVFINDKGVFEQLYSYLIAEEEFSPYKGNAFVLIYKDGTEIDLLPFGEIEDETRRVTVTGTGYTSVHVDGFREVYENDLPEIELGEHQFKVCTLPGIVLLKMIAWDDRPEARRDDILDISDILHHYFDMRKDIIWDEHFDLFEDEGAELPNIAAKVMGREIKAIASRSNHLHDRIESILNANTIVAETSKMAGIMVEYYQNTAEENLRLLRFLKAGYEE
jgi:predicted nucleotidyltransferase